MKIKESYINASENYSCGEYVYDVAGTLLEGLSEGEIFRRMQKEYGRCVSKVYVSLDEEGSVNLPVGWVFQRRRQYEDVKETYLAETWITLYDEHHEVPVREYHAIGKAE